MHPNASDVVLVESQMGASDKKTAVVGVASRPDIPPQDGRCILLELPPELRLMIHEALFVSFSKSISEQELHYLAAPLYTNKGIQAESKPALAKQAHSIHNRLLAIWIRAVDKIQEGQEDILSLSKWAREFPLEDQEISRAFKNC